MLEAINILVVEDERPQREMIEGFLKKEGYPVLSVKEGTQALKAIKENQFDLVLTDHKMPGMSGFELLKEIKKINPEIPVIIMTAYGTIDTAVSAMKEGAYDYLTKPLDLDELLLLISKVGERIQLLKENKALKERLKERYRFSQIIFSSPKMEEVLSLVERVADSNATVLIRGENGTGKELIANALHYSSQRADKPLVKVSCAAIPENLLESELFGHEKGAFTGAITRRIGKFEQADQGTIFLDEIGDLPLSLQTKLLRVLQEREFERIGGNQRVKVDVRIIAATNWNLEESLEKGVFREDLYYRLNVIAISLPPLRERKEDLPVLIDHFLKKYAEENQREVYDISREARDLLFKYGYPGNVRELENIIERAVVISRGNIITTKDLPFHLREEREEEDFKKDLKNKTLPWILEEAEKKLILQALERNAGVQTKAAQELGISERVLRYKIRKYKLMGR